MPFQASVKVSHQARSDRKLVGLPPRGVVCNRSIIRRRKDRPGLITLHAWPISDSSSFWRHDVLGAHSRSRRRSRSSLSAGRRSLAAAESISIPRKPLCLVCREGYA